MVKILVIAAFIVLPIKIAEKEIIKGKASYYADSFHGKRMADGTMYRRDCLTAASNQFPLGANVRIWQDGGDTVVVKVTDRMAKSTGKRRVLDLSKRAMKKVAGAVGIKKGVININIQQI